VNEAAGGPGLFGLSCGLIAAVVVGVWTFQALCVYWGALAAGIRGGFGRAMLVLLASILTSLPFILVLLLVMVADPSLYASSPSLLSAGVLLGGQTLAFKWVYGTTWGRALFGFFVSSLLSTGIIAGVLVAVF
jgi:hypothetical protein